MKRPAFTLLELLIVIAIMGSLMALTFPALQMAKESSNCLQCKANLRQIGMALQCYHHQLGHFPPGYIDKNTNKNSDASLDQGPGWGWAFLLLPYLEQKNTYDAVDLNQTAGHQSVCQKTFSFYICPSEPNVNTFTVAGTSTVVAQGNYIGNNGVKETSFYPGSNNGVFLRNHKMRDKEITDGLGTTLLIGERNSSHSRTTWVGSIPGGQVTADQSPDPAGYAELASALVLGHGSKTHLPNDSTVRDADIFYSKHVAGVNFLFGDGSVRTLSPAINGTTYENLLGRDDGQPVGDY